MVLTLCVKGSDGRHCLWSIYYGPEVGHLILETTHEEGCFSIPNWIEARKYCEGLYWLTTGWERQFKPPSAVSIAPEPACYRFTVCVLVEYDSAQKKDADDTLIIHLPTMENCDFLTSFLYYPLFDFHASSINSLFSFCLGWVGLGGLDWGICLFALAWSSWISMP